MRYVGIDVHSRQSRVCVLSETGVLDREWTVRGPWPKVVEALAEVETPFAVCYEASLCYGYLHDAVSKIAAEVRVAHPGQLRLIFRSKKKNDRADAKKLAKLLFLGEVPTVYVPTGSIRSWRQMIEHRVRLVNKRVRAKNGLRALLRAGGIVARRGLWSGKGLSWLRDVELPDDCACLRRQMLLDELEYFTTQITRVEKELDRIAARHAGVQLLRTIPAVGPRTAEAVLAYIDDPRRFGKNKSIGSYFGLVPRQDASGSYNRLGHITRDGPATVRRFLTEAAWQGISRSPSIRAYFQRIQRGDRERSKIAIVATAHYLARVMLGMLSSGEVWRENSRPAAA